MREINLEEVQAFAQKYGPFHPDWMDFEVIGGETEIKVPTGPRLRAMLKWVDHRCDFCANRTSFELPLQRYVNKSVYVCFDCDCLAVLWSPEIQDIVLFALTLEDQDQGYEARFGVARANWTRLTERTGVIPARPTPFQEIMNDGKS